MLKRPRFIVVACRGNRTSRTGDLGLRKPRKRRIEHAALTVHDTWLCGKIVATFTTETIRGGNRFRRAKLLAERECARLNEAYG